MSAVRPQSEIRHPTSYAELDGIEVKISEKYRYDGSNSAFLPQAEMAWMTLKDVSRHEYEYSFETELLVLQNFSSTNTKGHFPN